MASPTPGIRRRSFGTLPDGRAVDEFTLDNGRGLKLSTIQHGGIVTAVHCPDRKSRSANVVLGLPTLDDYVHRNQHFGTIVGRYGNRIAAGRFTLDGVAHQLAVNDPPNALHGGPTGFGSRWWHIEPLPPAGDGSVALALSYTSADGEEGYPGELKLQVHYTLTPRNEWRIDYRATTDRATVLNLTHHDYFNLSGGGSVLGHQLRLAASRYLCVDAALIPERIADVAGTPFDFREPTAIGARIRNADAQLQIARGYDHCWLLDRPGTGVLAFAARLEDPASGRLLEIETTEPGIQFYSGNFLDGRAVGSGACAYRQSDGLCLETQHLPDAPNRPDFPTTVLRPGEVFTSSTVHRFGLTPLPA